MKIRFHLVLFLWILAVKCLAQDVIDVVDPYQMRVSRSKQADTFYFQQNTPLKVSQRIDTLKTYDVFLEERPTPFGKAYMCNGVEVTKKRFFEYKALWNASTICKPCMMYTYSDKEELKHMAYQYLDCLCGKYIEYYPEGARKLEGQFKENTTGSWENLKSRDICNIRDGMWTYYLPNGIVEKTELYENGKLKSVSSPASNSSMSTKKNTLAPEYTNQEVTPKKGLLQRGKDKKSTESN